jgi:hypothetical protein
MMSIEDVAKFHAACKIIEVDGVEGYFTCRDRFGADVAGTALVMYLRTCVRIEDRIEDQDELVNAVNDILEEAGRLAKTITVEIPVDKKSLAGLWDVLVDCGIEPSLERIIKELQNDPCLLGWVIAHGASDTDVRNLFHKKILKSQRVGNGK